MAAISIGSGVTMKSSTGTLIVGKAGATGIVAGSAIYKKVTDNKWYLAVATVDMSSTSVVADMGVAVAPADAIDDAVLAVTGRNSVIDLGVALTDKSKFYLINSTPGAIAEYGDVTGSTYLSWWGYADGANFVFAPSATGKTK